MKFTEEKLEQAVIERSDQIEKLSEGYAKIYACSL